MSKKKITVITEELISEFLKDRNLLLWSCEFVKEGPDYFLRVYIDKEDGYISTQECEDVSRFLSEKLDEQDLIEREYYLEVSSPGMDRELTKREHFDRYRGSLVELKLYKPLNGSKQFEGYLVSMEEGIITVLVDDEEIKLSKEQIAKVNLAVVF
ncbi:MAG: ribosome maturation factor RimP [Eubacterium sp.]|nr:ribosome maturation factor RimP [Eubacterium sp.]